MPDRAVRELGDRGSLVHLLDNLTVAMVNLGFTHAPLLAAVGNLHAALHEAYDDGRDDEGAFIVARALTAPAE